MEKGLCVIYCHPKVGKVVFDEFTPHLSMILRKYFNDIVIVNGEFKTLSKEDVIEVLDKLAKIDKEDIVMSSQLGFRVNENEGEK